MLDLRTESPRLRACRLVHLACGLTLVACTGQILSEDAASSSSSSPGSNGSGSPATSSGSGGGTGLGSTPAEVEQACAETQGKLDVGLTRLRRLTRRELDNTLFVLLGVKAGAEETISPDERIGPFFSNAIAPITDLIVQQYQELAERVALEVRPRMNEIAPCNLETDTGTTCATQFVETFGRRAYRRPLQPTEVQDLVALYQLGKAEGTAADGFSAVIEGVLQSPAFLYHQDAGSLAAPSATPVAIDDYALASRLSYFLWNSMPDAELFELAQQGTLSDEVVLAAEVERMLEDPQAQGTIHAFHRQWLGFADLAESQKDPAVYPNYDAELAQAMLREADRFSDYVVRQGDGTLRTLLTSNLAFPEGPLFAIYGVAEPAGFVPGMSVPLDATRRAGLLTQAAFLTRHAHGNQTSPVHRGILVRENLLCQPLDPPPANVNASAPPPTPVTSTRERFEQHSSDLTCAGCHTLIDPIGMGFEHYDAVGAYRTTDGLGAVDASGEILSAREDLAGPFNGAIELAEKLAGSAEVADCVARQWFRFSLGRVESKSDACSIMNIQKGFAESQGNIRALLGRIALSDAFRHVRSTGGDAP